MKTITIVGVVSLLVFGTLSSAFASIDKNLKYGQRDDEVTELQEFLIDKGFLTGQATGNFYALTRKAVVAYQSSIRLPATGFVGPMTRAEINKELDVFTASSDQAEIRETGTNVAISSPVVDVCSNLNGTQTTIPSGMFNSGDGICFVPVVQVSSQTAQVAGVTSVIPFSVKEIVPTNTTVSDLWRINATGEVDIAKTQFIKKDGTVLPLTVKLVRTNPNYSYEIETKNALSNFAENRSLLFTIAIYSTKGEVAYKVASCYVDITNEQEAIQGNKVWNTPVASIMQDLLNVCRVRVD